MTATPRLYTDAAKAKARTHERGVFSMDDEAVYGPEFHRLPFSRAIERDLLSDYKVVVFAVSEQSVDAALQAHLAADSSEINLTDAAKIVGCWQALQDPEDQRRNGGAATPLKRAIAFTNTIAASQRIERHWGDIVDRAAAATRGANELACEVRHVDGKKHALQRKKQIDWLKGIDSPDDADGNACRILTNARCLSEGIDVPALDAVLFLNPRNSHVDVVQAVGRTMRKAEGKTYGYIILPIAVPAGVDPATALDDNKRFAVLWSVLRALRSHDDRFDAEINKLDLNERPTERIIFGGESGSAEEERARYTAQGALRMEFPAGALYAKIVDKCGDRKYWESWAKDVADIFSRLVTRIEGLLSNAANETLREWFEAFVSDLKTSINDALGRDDAIQMMAQHIITEPVFQAMFEGYDFAGHNPVAQALDALRRDFAEFGLDSEVRDLERFYESVRLRAQGLDNAEARQRVLMELYEKFFTTAMKKDADRLGIVYTPVEIVDYILNSADELLRAEFGRALSDQGVHVLDPFAGTGIFLVRLLQSGLIRDADLDRKYRHELHANEIVLLAYYIAAVSIEQAFAGRTGGDYEHFPGIALTDTFNLHTDKTAFPRAWMPANSERVERQQQLPIQVIIGNPPWSEGQGSSADNNPNVSYPALEERIANTYVAASTSTRKGSLYNTYKMALRWATDRIGEQGVIAMVTSASYIDGAVDSGLRYYLAREFSSVHVINLRGDQSGTLGERSRQEGGKIFGSGSTQPVAISILVKNPAAPHSGCRIHYHDIGDYLSRDAKLKRLSDAVSIVGTQSWRQIKPDRHNDWLRPRNQAFERLCPFGTEATKANKAEDAIFRLYSLGYITSRDKNTYSFSREACATNALGMVSDYMAALDELRSEGGDVESVTSRHASRFTWDRELRNNLRRGKSVEFSPARIRETCYRPFIKQHCYVDYRLANSKYQQDRVFPSKDSGNVAICAPGKGSKVGFSCLLVDAMPDRGLISTTQCFPRYRFERAHEKQAELLQDEAELQRVDNVTDWALGEFRRHYSDDHIDKDAIFDYTYGVLHARDLRERFANDLAKSLPRVPLAPDFSKFSAAGSALAKLHLGYESCSEYPLQVVVSSGGELRAEHCRLGTRAMRFEDDAKTTLVVNDHLRLQGIPEEAHRYVVGGRSPLGWFMDRYRITQKDGIVNDPNAWFEKDPLELVRAIRRIVHMSVETVRIVEDLPDALTDLDD